MKNTKEIELEKLRSELNNKEIKLKKLKEKDLTCTMLVIIAIPFFIVIQFLTAGIDAWSLLCMILILTIYFILMVSIYYFFLSEMKLKREKIKLRNKIKELERSLEEERQEREIRVRQEELLVLIEEGEKNLEKKKYSIAHQRFEKSLEIANKLESKEKQQEIQDKIKQVEEKKNIRIINQIKKIEKEADILKNKNKLKKAILEYQNALEKANEMFTSNEKKKELNKIKKRINEIYVIQIKELLEQGNQLRVEKSSNKAIGVFNNALEINNKMFIAHEKDQIKDKIETNFDLTYSDIISERMEKGNKLRKEMKFDNSIKIFKDALNIIEKMYNSNKKSYRKSKLKSLIHQAQIAKIKNTILNLGVKFGRLQVVEIAEECGESNKLIITTVKEMIENKEIYARYFSSTQTVAFDQQANIDEIDALMKQYKKWEEEGISKK